MENANRIIEANFKQDFSSFPFGHNLMIFFFRKALLKINDYFQIKKNISKINFNSQISNPTIMKVEVKQATVFPQDQTLMRTACRLQP